MRNQQQKGFSCQIAIIRVFCQVFGTSGLRFALLFNCKHENEGTWQSERHSSEMRSLKAFLLCSEASTLAESLPYWVLTVQCFPTWTSYNFHASFSRWHDPGVRHCWRMKRNFTRGGSCRAGFLLPGLVTRVRSSSLSHFCYANTPVRCSAKEDLYGCGSCCGLCFSSTCRQAKVGSLLCLVLYGCRGTWAVLALPCSVGACWVETPRRQNERMEAWHRDTAAILGGKELTEEWRGEMTGKKWAVGEVGERCARCGCARGIWGRGLT